MRRFIDSILIILSLTSGIKVMAQADISMATHWYNRANYNPASIARPEYFYLFSNVRNQWVGVKGAPQVLNLQASAYIHDLHSAFGLSIVSDKIGVTKSYNPMVTYAHRISNARDWSLSMGFSAGVFARSVDGSLYESITILDPAIQYDITSTIKPDANIGFEYQSNHFILSLSSTHLFSVYRADTLFLNTTHRYGSLTYTNNNPELFNYHLGIQVVNRHNLTVIEGKAGIRFKRPTFLAGGPKEIFDIGITYRSSQQITLLFGLSVSQNMRVGYAYDQGFSQGYTPNGSHEIMIEFRIPSKAASTRCNCMNADYWYH
ncbi:MAG: PorP/SprF family type IX secretion system membrane protein [Mariniphaga sp.]